MCPPLRFLHPPHPPSLPPPRYLSPPRLSCMHVLPVLLLVCILTEGRLAVLNLIGANRGEPVRACKALHMQRGAGAPTTHVLRVAFLAVRTGVLPPGTCVLRGCASLN